jgi:hypothetical protein
VPKDPESVEFGYYNVSVDRGTFVPMKMEFFDKQGKLYRIIESQKIETIEVKEADKVEKFPTVVKSAVKDLNTGSTTEMEFSNVQYNINLEDIFTERYLRRPPKEAIR